MSGFKDLLDKKVEDTTRPPVLPTGTYRLRAISAKVKEARDEDKNDRILFVYAVIEPQDDVDPDRIADISEEDFEGSRLFHNQWLGDKRDEFGLKLFLEKHGMDLSGRTYPEVLENIAGAEIMAYVEEGVDQRDGETPENSVGAFAAV